MNFISLINTIVTLALLMAVGFGLRKGGIIDDVFSKNLSTLIVKVGQPMLIISSLISLEYSAENLRRGLIALAVSFGIHTGMGIIAHFAVKGFRNSDERKVSEFALMFTNCGFIGFPIIESLYGKDGLFCGAFYLVGFHLFIWTWGMAILSRGRDDIKLTPRKIFINFGTVPCLIGFLLFLCPLKIPGFIVMTADYLAGLSTPVSVLITGALIATGTARDLFGRVGNYAVCLLRLLVLPAVVCVVLKLIGLSEFLIVFGTVMAAMPSASVITMFGEMYDIMPGFASRLVGVTSLLCVVTLPLMVAFASFIAGI